MKTRKKHEILAELMEKNEILLLNFIAKLLHRLKITKLLEAREM